MSTGPQHYPPPISLHKQPLHLLFNSFRRPAATNAPDQSLGSGLRFEARKGRAELPSKTIKKDERKKKAVRILEKVAEGNTKYILDNSHLAFFNEMNHFLSMYKKCMWEFLPLHPACFYEPNLQYAIINADEHSSLCLSLFTCLFMGAMLQGNRKMMKEFEGKVKTQLLKVLPSVIQEPDYSVAMVLLMLASFELYWNMSIANSKKYLTIAMKICEELNAQNGDIYVRCLYIAIVLGMDVSSEQIDDCATAPHYSMLNLCSATYGVETTKEILELVPYPLKYLSSVNEMSLGLGNIQRNLNYMKNNKAAGYAIDQQLVVDTYNSIKRMERYLKGHFQSSSLSLINSLHLTSFLMDLSILVGEYGKAVEYGRLFVKIAENQILEYTFNCSVMVIPSVFENLIFLRKTSLAYHLAQVIEPLANKIPQVRSIRDEFLQKLEECTSSCTAEELARIGRESGREKEEEGVEVKKEEREEDSTFHRFSSNSSPPLLPPSRSSSLLHHPQPHPPISDLLDNHIIDFEEDVLETHDRYEQPLSPVPSSPTDHFYPSLYHPVPSSSPGGSNQYSDDSLKLPIDHPLFVTADGNTNESPVSDTEEMFYVSARHSVHEPVCLPRFNLPRNVNTSNHNDPSVRYYKYSSPHSNLPPVNSPTSNFRDFEHNYNISNNSSDNDIGTVHNIANGDIVPDSNNHRIPQNHNHENSCNTSNNSDSNTKEKKIEYSFVYQYNSGNNQHHFQPLHLQQQPPNPPHKTNYNFVYNFDKTQPQPQQTSLSQPKEWVIYDMT
eukprot:CAMPEP_0174252030 /NCGR_PEP_ID=MMETSP0439-20130205/1670_1 /TAXON_ID=0 /ORGANISM="Stereomyxa ramosa, Strain Chinc5" /LENGTH=779 /DNA_ID=CAMNT_0015332507 /DNA_START=125 /DNA_END=2460 /DNA_ORIENTATION=+